MRTMPVVVVEGPRAAGKTTLVRSAVGDAKVFDLSSADVYEQAQASPRAWVEGLPLGAAIDEAQRIANLSLEIKRQSDARPGIKGQYLLTGSVRLRRDELGGSDPLVGRVRRCTLLPFAQCELGDGPRDVIAALFDGSPSEWNSPPTPQADMFEIMRRGGFPLIQDLNNDRDRRTALGDYARDLFTSPATQTRRDASALLGLFRWLSASSGQMQRITEFGRANGLAKDTVSAYLTELQQAFLIRAVPGWHRQPGKRETQTPRLFVVDPAFSADAHDLGRHRGAALESHGRIFETFAVTELERLASWSSIRATTYHWREDDNREVDIVLEDESTGRLVAFEIKAARESSSKFFNGLRAFKQRYPDRFHRGFVFHCGDHPLRHDDDLWSLPFSALWTIGDRVDKSGETNSLDRALSDLRSKIMLSRTTAESRGARLDRIANSAANSFAQLVVKLANVTATLDLIGYSSVAKPDLNTAFSDDGGEASEVKRFGISYSTINENDEMVLRMHGVAVLRANGEIVWTLRMTDANSSTIGEQATTTDWDASDLEERLDDLVAAFTQPLGPFLAAHEGRPAFQRP